MCKILKQQEANSQRPDNNKSERESGRKVAGIIKSLNESLHQRRERPIKIGGQEVLEYIYLIICSSECFLCVCVCGVSVWSVKVSDLMMSLVNIVIVFKCLQSFHVWQRRQKNKQQWNDMHYIKSIYTNKSLICCLDW